MARYKLGRVIGEGGMATVLEAEDSRLQRTVAIKKLKPKVAERSDHRSRFYKEARIIGGLSHPGMIAVHDAGTLELGEPFYAMAKVQGDTLFKLLHQREPSDLRDRHAILRFVDIFERVCQTLAYAHSRGIIHRDVKPGNVMVDRFGAVFVMDWGIAKQLVTEETPFVASETREGVVMGTPGYMSPEQAQGLPGAADLKTDVFALGVILYEILTGKAPFQGKNPREVVEEVLYHEPQPPLALNRTAGRELSAICMKALAKDPRKRYPSAEELAADVALYRQLRPVSAIRPRLVDRVGKWIRRNRVAASAAATLLVAAVAVAGYLGTKAHLNRRMVDSALALVEVDRQEIAALDREARQIEEQLLQAGLDPGMRQPLEDRLSDLDARITVKAIDNRSRMAAVIGATMPSPDPRALTLFRGQTRTVIEELLEIEDYALARAFLLSALERFERGNPIGYSREEIDRMRALLGEIESRQPVPATGEPATER
jgi:serine/threonine-protein kinase